MAGATPLWLPLAQTKQKPNLDCSHPFSNHVMGGCEQLGAVSHFAAHAPGQWVGVARVPATVRPVCSAVGPSTPMSMVPPLAPLLCAAHTNKICTVDIAAGCPDPLPQADYFNPASEVVLLRASGKTHGG